VALPPPGGVPSDGRGTDADGAGRPAGTAAAGPSSVRCSAGDGAIRCNAPGVGGDGLICGRAIGTCRVDGVSACCARTAVSGWAMAVANSMLRANLATWGGISITNTLPEEQEA
jgi:hypothetical protein